MTNKHLFSRLLNKAIFMALWTKAITCDKAGFKSRFCQEHQAGKYKISVNLVILSNFSSCLRVFVAKTPRNLRNPRLIKDLRLFNALYNCKETFTDVMSALQIKLFLQNKANFKKVKFNVNKVLTKDYDQMDTWSIGKTKPIKANSKPIKANSKPIKANSKPIKANIMPTCRGVASGEAGNKPNSCPPSVWLDKGKEEKWDAWMSGWVNGPGEIVKGSSHGINRELWFFS
jgi:hypothetical protein